MVFKIQFKINIKKGKPVKAKEFIIESEPKLSKIHPRDANGFNNAAIFRDQTAADRFHAMYRIGLAAGMADGKSTKAVDVDPATWHSKYNVSFPYTELEDNMMQAAFNTVPTDYRYVKKGKSKEADDTHKVSPIANWMKKD